MLQCLGDHTMRILFIALSVAFMVTNTSCKNSDAMGEDQSSRHTTATSGAPDVGVAVVELFTSEGCSSCPPAEAVLAKIAADAEKNGRPIFSLAFHVDYWNRLGWADPFSNAANSDRQSRYGQFLKLDQIYTPQMIVNGKTEFVGSDQDKANRAIAAALKTPVVAKIEAAVRTSEMGGHQISYAVTTVETSAVVNIAVGEQGLTSDVKRGENAGRTLHDPSVVRWFRTERLGAAKNGSIDIPKLPGVDLEHATVIVFIQRAADLSVIGATKVNFPAR